MTTFNPFASVVLSIAICSCFTLVPPLLSLLSSCSQPLIPIPPASSRNLAPKPRQPNDSLLYRPARIPAANPSSPPCARPPRHNLRAKAAQSKPLVDQVVQNFPEPDASTVATPGPPRGVSFRPRDRAASSIPQSARERPRARVPSVWPYAQQQHLPRS